MPLDVVGYSKPKSPLRSLSIPELDARKLSKIDYLCVFGSDGWRGRAVENVKPRAIIGNNLTDRMVKYANPGRRCVRLILLIFQLSKKVIISFRIIGWKLDRRKVDRVANGAAHLPAYVPFEVGCVRWDKVASRILGASF